MRVNLLKRIDMFGEAVSFNIDGHQTTRSNIGGVCTVLAAILVAIYASQRAQTMMDYGDTKFQAFEEADKLDMSRVFTGEEMGFNIAFSVVAANATKVEDITDVLEYGVIQRTT